MLKYRNVRLLPLAPKIFIGIDGVHLVGSSSSQFWVIVGYLPCLENSTPFVIGIFHGYEKPKNCNEFLDTIVQKALGLSEIGLDYLCENWGFYLRCPSMGYDYLNERLFFSSSWLFPLLGFGITVGALRTDQTFRDGICRHRHNGTSILERLIYLEMVFDILLDPMHLVDRGVMRRMLQF